MPLSDDQRAMLRLLAQREQGYDDIAALMGLSVDEVRARVKDALSQLEDEGVAPPPLPAEPPAAEEPAKIDAVAPVEKPATPEPDVPAEPSAARPPAPAQPPEAEKAGPAAPVTASAKPKRTPPPRPSVSLPKSGGARAAIAAGVVVVIALIVVLAVSGSGGGSSGDSTVAASGEATTASEGATGTTPTSSKEVTQATLSPVDGGDANGVATFGRVKNSLALQIEAAGLAPTAKGQSYAIWLYDSPQKMLPLATTAVTQSGKIGAQVEVPTEVLAYLAKETFDQIDVSLTSDAKLKASLNKATKEKKSPAYTGTDVLRGQITGPIIGAANKAKKE